MKTLNILSDIRIASPCPVSWEQMTGDRRVRHCSQCNLNVYNFSEMTAREIEKLVAASKGQRLCGRLYRRADGTMLTRDCPVGWRKRVQRVSRKAGAVLAAALSATFSFAQKPQDQSPASIQVPGADSAIDLVVTDLAEAVIPNAHISIVKAESEAKYEGITNQDGSLRIANLRPGKYTISVAVPGFRAQTMDIALARHQDVRSTITIYSAALSGVVAIDNQKSLKNRLASFGRKLGF